MSSPVKVPQQAIRYVLIFVVLLHEVRVLSIEELVESSQLILIYALFAMLTQIDSFPAQKGKLYSKRLARAISALEVQIVVADGHVKIVYVP